MIPINCYSELNVNINFEVSFCTIDPVCGHRHFSWQALAFDGKMEAAEALVSFSHWISTSLANGMTRENDYNWMDWLRQREVWKEPIYSTQKETIHAHYYTASTMWEKNSAIYVKTVWCVLNVLPLWVSVSLIDAFERIHYFSIR